MLASLAHVIHYRRPPRIDFVNLLVFCVNFPPQLIRRDSLDDSGKFFSRKARVSNEDDESCFFFHHSNRRIFLAFSIPQIIYIIFIIGKLRDLVL